MDAKTYFNKYGADKTEQVCLAAGTNLAYYKQCMYGHRNFSRKLAKKLVEESNSELSLINLLDPPTAG